MDNIARAIHFANQAYAGQFRKGTQIPYIFHVINVGRILAEQQCTESEIIAGILHDTIEDTSVTYQQIEEDFGREVAELVLSASEPNREESWEDKKADHRTR